MALFVIFKETQGDSDASADKACTPAVHLSTSIQGSACVLMQLWHLHQQEWQQQRQSCLLDEIRVAGAAYQDSWYGRQQRKAKTAVSISIKADTYN